jgi:hypothetical protein
MGIKPTRVIREDLSILQADLLGVNKAPARGMKSIKV